MSTSTIVVEYMDAVVQVNINLDDMTPSHGVCLIKGCQNCPLHKQDQRKVHAEKTKVVNKLIKAGKDKDLTPGTYIF